MAARPTDPEALMTLHGAWRARWRQRRWAWAWAVMGLGMGGAVQAVEVWEFATEPFPPYNYEDAGRATGATTEVVRAVCEQMKIECHIEVMPWRRALRQGVMGEVMGVFSMRRLPEREAQFFFTDPFIAGSYALFSAPGRGPVYQRPTDLVGYTVAAYGPSGTETSVRDLVQEVAGVTVVRELSNEMALKKLAAGRFGPMALVACNRDVCRALIRQLGLNLVEVGEYGGFQYGVGISRRKASAAQFAQFNEALQTLMREGKVKPVLDRFGVKGL